MKATRLKLLHVKTGEPKQITFLVSDMDLQRARNFIAAKNEREEKTGVPVWIDADLRFWYPERTQGQNRFYWRFVEALAQDAGLAKDEEHEILKEAFLPSDEVLKHRLVKQGRTWELVEYRDREAVSTTRLTTVEFAGYCEQVIMLCADRGLDIYKDYLEWQQWLHENQWPLSETYRNADEYRARHPVCEFCGKDIKWEDGHYTRGEGEIMHIVSRGAGGIDAAWNLIHGCVEHHRTGVGSQHTAGWEPILERYPHMRNRVEYAERKHRAMAQKGGIE